MYRDQINEGCVYEKAVLFPGTDFLRVTEKEDGMPVNTSYGWEVLALSGLGILAG